MSIGAALAWDDDLCEVTIISSGEDTYLVTRIRGRRRTRRQARIGAPDAALTANAGLAAITELCGRLGVIGAIDTAAGPVKQRDRGFSAGELLAGIAAAQLAGEDFLAGLDRQRADTAGQQLTPVPGLSSTTAAGLARRVTPAQWEAVETGLAAVTARMLALLPAPRRPPTSRAGPARPNRSWRSWPPTRLATPSGLASPCSASTTPSSCAAGLTCGSSMTWPMPSPNRSGEASCWPGAFSSWERTADRGPLWKPDRRCCGVPALNRSPRPCDAFLQLGPARPPRRRQPAAQSSSRQRSDTRGRSALGPVGAVHNPCRRAGLRGPSAGG